MPVKNKYEFETATGKRVSMLVDHMNWFEKHRPCLTRNPNDKSDKEGDASSLFPVAKPCQVLFFMLTITIYLMVVTSGYVNNTACGYSNR